MYWGPLPAVLAAGAKYLYPEPVLYDAYFALVFALVRLIFGTLLLGLIFRQYFKTLSKSWMPLAVSVFSLSAPFPNIITRPLIYEAASAGGQCFLVAGLYFFLRGLLEEKGRKWKHAFTLLSGVAFSAALATRLSLAPAVVGISVVSLFLRWKDAKKWREGIPYAVLLVGPIVVSILILAAYNYVRFGSVTEFGVTYQLTVMPYGSGLKYVLYNLNLYMVSLPRALDSFPFLSPGPAGREIINSLLFVPQPSYYWGVFPRAGVFTTVPISAFAVPGFFWLRQRFKMANVPSNPAEAMAWQWLLWACSCIVLLGVVPLLVMYASILRYIADFSSGLLILGIVAHWEMSRKLGNQSVARGVWAVVIGAVSVASILLGVLLSFGGETVIFVKYNPGLMEFLTRLFG